MTDIVIIGSGAVGLPTAYYLAQEGMHVTLVDKATAPAQGSFKSAIGGVRATHSDPAKITICEDSLRIFSTWEEKTGTDIGWKKGGYCFPAYRSQDEDLLKSMLRIQHKYNLKIEWLDADGVKKAAPGINENRLIGGTLSADDGQASPLLFASSLTEECERLGVEFRFSEQATKVIVKYDRVVGLETNKGTIATDCVLDAAGAGATQVAATVNVQIPVSPDSHEAGVSMPIEHFLDPLVVDLRPDPEGRTSNFYFGQTKDGSVIFCYTPSPIIPGEDRRCTSEFLPNISRRLLDIMPRFKNLVIRRLWRGLYPMTPDGSPILGRAANVNGFYLAVGMGGQGFMMGPGVARNMAHYITTGKSYLESDLFESLSPQRDFHARREALE
ncbi:MAG TPA: FAD-dependent oxidoreductase [Terriglobales bacterium]|nr:FAD-dependent oxidoreductase [Terriglobales bacterium]